MMIDKFNLNRSSELTLLKNAEIFPNTIAIHLITLLKTKENSFGKIMYGIVKEN